MSQGAGSRVLFRIWVVITAIWVAMGFVFVDEHHPHGVAVFVWRWIGIPASLLAFAHLTQSVREWAIRRFSRSSIGYLILLIAIINIPLWLISIDSLLIGNASGAIFWVTFGAVMTAIPLVLYWILSPLDSD